MGVGDHSDLAAAFAFREGVIPSDGDVVRGIVQSSGFFSAPEVAVAVELVQERLTRGADSGYHFLFALYEGSPVGYTCFGPIPCTVASFDLYWIAVHERCRGMGLGRALLCRTEFLIARAGGRRVYIETSSRPLYAPTRTFYMRCAYREEAVLEEFYAPGDSKIIFSRCLDVPPDR